LAAGISDYNPIAHWTCDETSGVRYDSTANAFDLTDNNTVSYATGLLSNACDFERGNSEYLSITDQAVLDLPSNFTVNMWVNLESLPSTYSYSPGLFTKVASGSGYAITIDWSGSNQPVWVRHDAASSIIGTTGLSVSTWYMMTFTFDGTNIKYYLNGASDASQQAYSAHTGNNYDLNIGRSTLYTTRYYDGLIDEISVFDTALTGAEVAVLYNSGTPLPFTGESMSSTTDMTGVVNALTLLNDNFVYALGLLLFLLGALVYFKAIRPLI